MAAGKSSNKGGMKGMPSILIGAAFLAVTAFYFFYQRIKYSGKRNKALELFYKGGATLVCALLAGYGYFADPRPGYLLLTLGLFVCVAADVLIDLYFLPGTLCFGLGHMAYCAGYVLLNRPGTPSLLLFIACAAAALLLYPALKKLSGSQSPLPYLLYTVLIGAMLSLALPQRPVLLLGAALFVMSDGLLLVRIIRKIPSKAYDYLCLGVYFLAQFLIAVSCVI